MPMVVLNKIYTRTGDAAGMFGHPLADAKRRQPGVAGTGIDLVQNHHGSRPG